MNRVTVRIAVLVDGLGEQFTASAPMSFTLDSHSSIEEIANTLREAIKESVGPALLQFVPSLVSAPPVNGTPKTE